MDSKCCTRCQQLKPLEMFPRRRAYKDGRRAICKACKSTEAIAYNAAHRDEQRAYRIAHLEETHTYRITHAKAHRAYRKAYRTEHQDEHRCYEAARRARKRQAPVNDLSHAQWLEIQEVFQHRCAYCGKRAKGRLTQDHVTPLSNGGAHTASNIVPACSTCNYRKHAKDVPSPVQPILVTVALAKTHNKRDTKSYVAAV